MCMALTIALYLYTNIGQMKLSYSWKILVIVKELADLLISQGI